MSISARQWLDKIHQLHLPYPVKIMNVCGGHERAISQAGIRAALPGLIKLIPGPGCPVCICPEEDVYEVIQLALHEDIILVAFGDMLRVPVNAPKNEARSLQQAKAAGADIRPIASPLDALTIANENPNRRVVFFAAGFETTVAPVAAMMVESMPQNLLLFLSARLTWPAVSMLLEAETPGFNALIAPGHVATVMGSGQWQFVVNIHHMPAAVSGFHPQTLLAAIYSVLRQLLEKNYFLDNCYGEVVRPEGNQSAQRCLAKVMDIVDANWRGIGVISRSGYQLKAAYSTHDARNQLPSYHDESRRRIGQMPAGCDCAKVVLGKILPNQCRLYGVTCQPRKPIGPCMVSDEGACRIWWASGVRENSAGHKNTSLTTDIEAG